MLNVQQFIKEEGLNAVSTQLGIKITPHKAFPNLVGLKYSQIDSPKAHPVVIECRGIILDTSRNLKVTCRGMDRFFNYGEETAAKLDLMTTKLARKEDGSLTMLYHYAGNWHVATSGSPDASGEVGSWGLTFKQLFWQVFDELGYSFPHYTGATYFFELMTPKNRIVVNNGKENKLVYLGMRDNETGQEFSAVPLANNWQAVTWEILNADLADIKADLDTKNGLECEGYVLRDANFNRIKIKGADYVRLHHAVSSLSPKNIMEVIRNGEGAEFLASFDNYADFVGELTSRFECLKATVTDQFLACKRNATDKKSFALKAVNTRCPSALFALYDGKVKTVSEYFASCNVELLLKLLKVESLP